MKILHSSPVEEIGSSDVDLSDYRSNTYVQLLFEINKEQELLRNTSRNSSIGRNAGSAFGSRRIKKDRDLLRLIKNGNDPQDEIRDHLNDDESTEEESEHGNSIKLLINI